MRTAHSFENMAKVVEFVVNVAIYIFVVKIKVFFIIYERYSFFVFTPFNYILYFTDSKKMNVGPNVEPLKISLVS